jgi:hypothetical protein
MPSCSLATLACVPTGVLPYSGGDALIYGQSISSEGGLDAVRPLMGVCPQFDVLWGELTGAEHLGIYGHIKGLPFSQVGGEQLCHTPGGFVCWSAAEPGSLLHLPRHRVCSY